MSEPLRLQKLLSRAGVSSRRHAEVLIRAGRVTVNGEVVRTMGTKIDPDKDRVMVDGKPVEAEEPKVTVLLYKPDRVVTTMSDPEGRPTIAQLVKDEPFRLLPVGRLDFHTEGALLLTTDGELANRLQDQRSRIPKVYAVKLSRRPRPEAIAKLRSGVPLEDGKTEPAMVEILEEGDRHTWIELIITESKRQQIGRMCEAVGLQPDRVVRMAFSTLALDDLRPGQYRYLRGRDLGGLYRLAGLGHAPEVPEEIEDRIDRFLGTPERGRGALPGSSKRR